MKILVIEDHDLLRHAIVDMLCDNGHDAEGVFSVEALDETRNLTTHDIYVVDLNLPGEDGLSLASRLRQVRPSAGIVIVSARTELDDRLIGYKTGADNYLTKPVDPDELLAVIESIAQRLDRVSGQRLFQLHVNRLTIEGAQAQSTLSSSEVRLLVGLAQAKDNTLEHIQVASFLNLEPSALNRANLNVRLSQLRKKLQHVGAQEPTIKAVRGHGYKLCIPLEVL